MNDGIIIFTAGREDAYRDYQRSVKSGHTFDELEPHLSDGELERLTETYECDTAHVWGTSVLQPFVHMIGFNVGFKLNIPDSPGGAEESFLQAGIREAGHRF